MNRERLHNNQPTVRRNISITDQDLSLAKSLGDGNVSHGIKLALRIAYSMEEHALEWEKLTHDA